MKIIVAGSRKFNNYYLLKTKLNNILANKDDIEIVSGTADGADKLGERYAEQYKFKLTKFPAKWDLYGGSAGYIRNEEMAMYADALVAFWDGTSRGTNHMIKLAEKHRLLVRVIQV